MVKSASDYPSSSVSASSGGSSSSSSSSPAKTASKSSEPLDQQIRDALSGQTISYVEQDALEALLDELPSDPKELKKKFYAAVPMHDIQPDQQNKLNKIWADQGVSDADPKTPAYVEPAASPGRGPSAGGLQPPAV